MAVELERLNNQVIAELVAKHGKEKEDFENYRNTLISEIDLLRTLLHNEKEEKDLFKERLKAQEAENKSRETTIKELREEIRLRDERVKQLTAKMESMQNQVKSFKKTLDENIEQLSKVKDLTSTIKREKDELLFERDCLKARAAVAFEDLTPRPNYQKIMEEKKIELGIRTDALWRDKPSKSRLRTEQIFEGLIVKYLGIVKANQELEKQAKRSQISDSPASVARKRPSIAIKNALLFVNNSKSSRPSVTNPGTSVSKFSVKEPQGIVPKITINKAEGLPNSGIDEAESNKSDSQFIDGESEKKHTDTFKLMENYSENSPLAASKGTLGTDLVPIEHLSSFSLSASPSRKQSHESKEDREEHQQREVLKIDLPEALGIKQDGSESDRLISEKADDLIGQLTQTRDALQKFYQKNDS